MEVCEKNVRQPVRDTDERDKAAIAADRGIPAIADKAGELRAVSGTKIRAVHAAVPRLQPRRERHIAAVSARRRAHARHLASPRIPTLTRRACRSARSTEHMSLSSRSRRPRPQIRTCGGQEERPSSVIEG